MTSNVIRLIICFALIFGIAQPLAQAAESHPQFIVKASKEQGIETGTELTITVRGEALQDMFGYELVMEYDRERLVFLRAASLQTPGYRVTPQEKNGEIVFAFTKIGASTAAISGAADLASFTFRASSEGEAYVSLVKAKAVKKDATALEYAPLARVELDISASTLPEPVISFLDVPEEHWAKEAIDRAVTLGIVKGYADGTFKPQKPVTRAEFVTMLVRALQPRNPLISDKAAFTDEAEIGEWARAEVALAVGSGWINGFSDGSFRPGRQITRSEMTTIAARALGLTVTGEERSESGMESFSDWSRVPSWAKPAFAAAVENGLIQGRGGNRLAPEEPTNRAESIVLILRLLDYSAGVQAGQ